MNKKLSKEHSNVINAVAESASRMADKVNKAGKSLHKMGKQLNKAKNFKEVVSASQMKSTTIYKGVSDGKLYRRPTNGKIETMVGSQWVEVKVNYDFLNNEEFREY